MYIIPFEFIEILLNLYYICIFHWQIYHNLFKYFPMYVDIYVGSSICHTKVWYFTLMQPNLLISLLLGFESKLDIYFLSTTVLMNTHIFSSCTFTGSLYFSLQLSDPLRAGFLNLDATNIWGRMTFVVGLILCIILIEFCQCLQPLPIRWW